MELDVVLDPTSNSEVISYCQKDEEENDNNNVNDNDEDHRTNQTKRSATHSPSNTVTMATESTSDQCSAQTIAKETDQTTIMSVSGSTGQCPNTTDHSIPVKSPSPLLCNTEDREGEKIKGCAHSDLATDHKANPSPLIKVTRFSIEDILAPGFGNGIRLRSQKFKTDSLSHVKECEITPASIHLQSGASTKFPQNHASQSLPHPVQHFSHTSRSHVSVTHTPGQGQGRQEGEGQILRGSDESPGSEMRVPPLWPAWVYCTRYSDRPSSGPRSRKIKRKEKDPDEKRPRTAFTSEQLIRLKGEFDSCRYLTEERRQRLAQTLSLSEAQIKIWFQNKRAKVKKSSGQNKTPLALNLIAQGLYNHSTVTVKEES